MMGTINWNKRKFDAPFLRSILYYGAPTGYWFWLVDRGGRAKAGSRAGGLDSEGYWEIRINGIDYPATNLAWLYITGDWPPIEVDHINRNRLDDRWDNLRLATVSQQNMNKGLHPNNTSGVTGVRRDQSNNCWESHIQVNYNHTYLGSFKSFEEAVAARRSAEIQYFGAFAPEYAAKYQGDQVMPKATPPVKPRKPVHVTRFLESYICDSCKLVPSR